MNETEVVPCHTCGAEVASVRSAILQLLPGQKLVHLIIAPGLVSTQVVDLGARQWTGPDDPAYIHYRKNIAQRRSFICEKCYGMLDMLDGLAEIERDGKVMLWSMSVSSRGDRAAIYDWKKWRAYQKKAAGSMGIEVAE